MLYVLSLHLACVWILMISRLQYTLLNFVRRAIKLQLYYSVLQVIKNK